MVSVLFGAILIVNHPHPVSVANLRFLADRSIRFPYLQFHQPALPVLGIVAEPSIFIPAPRRPMFLPLPKMYLALGHPIFVPVRPPAMELAVFKLPMVFYFSGWIPLIIISMLQTILVVQPCDHTAPLVPACPKVSLHPLVLHRHVETPPVFGKHQISSSPGVAFTVYFGLLNLHLSCFLSSIVGCRSRLV